MSDGADAVGVLDLVLPAAPDVSDGDASDSSEPAFGVLDAVRDSIGVCSVPTGDRTAAEWMALVAECGRAMTALSAARDAAMVRMAAIDEVVDEDGVVGEQVNGLGAVCLDAGSMVATATGCSPGFGEELLDQAVVRVVRVPALHEAMLAGLLDDYAARCIASELTDAPVDIARAVVDALAKDFGVRSGPALRRRTRELLFRMAPELLRKRIAAARKKIGLRRWVGEPGTDQWGGTFASEQAATAWAAVDALARRYRTEDTYPTLEMARAYALLDLVHGRASVRTVLSLTVPAGEVGDEDSAAGDSARAQADSVGGMTRGRRRASPESMSGQDGGRSRNRSNRSTETDSTKKASDEMQSSDSDDAGRRYAAESRADVGTEDTQDGDAGADDSGADVSDDPDAGADVSDDPDAGPDDVDSRHADDAVRFVAVSGAQGCSLTWMPLSALPLLVRAAGCAPSTRECHPVTGAVLDVADALATEAYTPGERLKRLVRARDGRCRFPGCTVPARSCDIDHVDAWPRGPTSATNLMCLCRRHHRVKQRMRWQVRIGDDARVAWTDPMGVVRVTEPVDHLGVSEARSARLRDVDVAADRDQPQPCTVSIVEAVVGVLVEHPVAAAARELRSLHRRRRQPDPREVGESREFRRRDPREVGEAHRMRPGLEEPSRRRPGARCGYVDLHPHVEGSTVVVEFADDEINGYRRCGSRRGGDGRFTGSHVRTDAGRTDAGRTDPGYGAEPPPF